MGDWAFAYDAQNRLHSGLAGSGRYNTLNLAWSYDRYGNRWDQAASGNPPTGITQPTPPHFTSNGNPDGNVNNHVDGYNYDAAGDVTADSLNQYAYDGEGRLCAAYSGNGVYTEYIYNAEGDRVAKGSASDLSCNPASDGFAMTNRYIIGPTGEQLSEMNGSGGWLHTNVFAGGKLLATYGGTDTYFALTDWLGTKRVEADSAGSTVSTSYSLPFGDNLVVNGSPDATEHHFTGKEHDSNTGNDYFLARYYNSPTGRFLSPDWSKNPEGVPYADFSDPQSLNLYDYMRNNPLGGVDAEGHWPGGNDSAILSAPIIVTRKMEAKALKLLSNPIVQLGMAFIPGGAEEDAIVDSLSATTEEIAPVEESVTGAEATQLKASEQEPLVGNNPKEAGNRTNTDLPGGHKAAKKVFGEQTSGQKVRTDPKTGHQVSSNGSRLRLNTDGTARVDLPNRGARPNGETIHFNDPDKLKTPHTEQ